ncbi:zinc finger protein CONSTANS-LIKE 4-like protein [Tanacetum coccineum]
MSSPTKTLLCESCKTTSASLYCKADSAYLCIPCDTTIHHANKLASRHARVWLCHTRRWWSVSGGGGGGYDDVAVVDVVEGLPAYDVINVNDDKPFMYNFTAQSISQSVSSSSLEVGVVPDHTTTMADVSNNHHNQSSTEVYPTPLMGLDREARVLRYKEKRKNRKFEKTIRYASRKAYAETRPRIKGRFAKRTTDESVISQDSSYGVVPSY